jgi:hypothetical protein
MPDRPGRTRQASPPAATRAAMLRAWYREYGPDCTLCGQPTHISCGNQQTCKTHAVVGHTVDHVDGGTIGRDGWRLECRRCSNRGGQAITTQRLFYGDVTIGADQVLDEQCGQAWRRYITASGGDHGIPPEQWTNQLPKREQLWFNVVRRAEAWVRAEYERTGRCPCCEEDQTQW